MTIVEILKRLPYSSPFLFVDEILEVNEQGIIGTFMYDPLLDFYKGHFTGYPLTPGVILTETMAQIGLVCFGIYLTKSEGTSSSEQVVLTSTSIDFFKPVFPGEKVTVYSEKVYFRFNKLKCNVHMENEGGEIVCKGTIAGMVTNQNNG
jgi:3-hydroxyacyl-[acyl-carrier-protein] dehydratase